MKEGFIYRSSALTWLLVAPRLGLPNEISLMIVHKLDVVDDPLSWTTHLKKAVGDSFDKHPVRWIIYLWLFISSMLYHTCDLTQLRSITVYLDIIGPNVLLSGFIFWVYDYQRV